MVNGHFRIPHPQISEHLRKYSLINFIGFSSYFWCVTFYLRFYAQKTAFIKKYLRKKI